MKKHPFQRSRRLKLAIALAACLGTPVAGADETSFSDIAPGSAGPAYHTAVLQAAEDASLGDLGLIDADQAAVSEDSVPAKDYEKLLERVGELESSWEKYQEELKEESAAKKKKPAYKLNGRVHLDNWNFLDSDPGVNELETGNPNDDPEDRWDFRRIRLTWSGTVPHNMLYRIQIDFNNPSSAEMKDVFLGWENLPSNQTLLLGNQKRPLGLDHLNSSRHNVFIERPLAVEAFNEDARRLGLCMYGSSDDEVVNWRYGAFLLENISTDGRYRGDSNEAGLYGRLAASPWYDEISGGRGYWHCAVAGSVNQTDGDGTIDADQNSNEARFRTRPEARSDSRWWDTGRILGAEGYQELAFESMLNIGAFQLTAEYINTWVQRDAMGGFNGSDLHFQGGYLFANYFLTGEHIPLKRTAGTIDRVKPFENFFLVDRCTGGKGNGWGALSMGLRGDYLDLSDSDIRGGNGYTVTAGMNWYWTAYSKIQMNYVTGSIENAGQGRATGPLVAGIGGDFNILGFRYMIDF
ncbi:OprO/OprP family phosphate-selective porin [Stieleria sp. TO1_6]|uniref:OprO/OprP family phosphate-selective porin n=1 Tax=Stieleria tagensis TaxID=2956795 RepID=UPI00209B6BA1|nr:porin [Stieleria tagensis]MCO8121155.1 OprO/OprP family phosphate-selective porin [Stieleria tagensis]